MDTWLIKPVGTWLHTKRMHKTTVSKHRQMYVYGYMVTKIQGFLVRLIPSVHGSIRVQTMTVKRYTVLIGLRAMCRKAWRFKSSPAHKLEKSPQTGIFYSGNSDPKGFPWECKWRI